MKNKFNIGDLVIPIRPSSKQERDVSPEWTKQMDEFDEELCVVSSVYNGGNGTWYLCYIEGDPLTDFYFHEMWLMPVVREFNFSPNKQLSSLLKRR